MDTEDLLRYISSTKTKILDIKHLMTDFGDTLSANELDQLTTDLTSISNDHTDALAALKALPPAEEGVESTDELFRQALEELKSNRRTRNSIDTEDDNDMPAPAENSILGDKSIVLSQHVDSIPIDPMTKCKIQDPARNQVCKHVYEFNIIMAYIKQFTKSKRNNKIKCPYIGCNNNNMKATDIEKDDELKRKIISMISTEEVDPDSSIVDILNETQD